MSSILIFFLLSHFSLLSLIAFLLAAAAAEAIFAQARGRVFMFLQLCVLYVKYYLLFLSIADLLFSSAL